MRFPEDRPAPPLGAVARLPVLLFGFAGLVLASAVWLAARQTGSLIDHDIWPAMEIPIAVATPPTSPGPDPLPAALPQPEDVAALPPPDAAVVAPVQLAPAGAEADSGVAVPDRYDVVVRIERGDTMANILDDLGIAAAERPAADAAFRKVLKGPRLPAGETITAQLLTPADPTQPPVLLQLSLRPRIDREIILQRGEDGSYDAQEKIYKIEPRIVRASGAFVGGVRASGEAAGIPAQVMAELTRAFSYDIDFQRDIRRGDRFHVLIEQAVTTDGRVANPGRLLWAELGLKRGTVQVWRFRPQGGAEQFYTGNGESVVRSFLRTPMDVSRVSSRFGWREHPILGYSAMHAGVDFAAPYGTPVLAAGAGKVEMAGFNGGYGNYVRVRHTREVATAYAHLARYAPGIKPGTHVRQGQVIGFVGSTGMSTGPHLHYEFHRNGRQVNPLGQRVSMRNQLAGKDLARFQAQVGEFAKQRKTAIELEAPEAAPVAATVAAQEPEPVKPAAAKAPAKPEPAKAKAPAKSATPKGTAAKTANGKPGQQQAVQR
jgi:murein DD-endopeptidase MepM/ murein hydrolase activator NlpD